VKCAENQVGELPVNLYEDSTEPEYEISFDLILAQNKAVACSAAKKVTTPSGKLAK